MRCDQFMGFNSFAQNLIEQQISVKIKGVKEYPDGKQIPFEEIRKEDAVKKERFASYAGMFEEEYPLYKYTLPDGSVYFGFVQASPWSSGPVFFLALKDEKGNEVKESLWSEEEINNC